MPHEFEVREEITLDATPEQVWAAIATGPGIDSWFMGRNEIEPREGGRTRMTMGDMTAEGTVTAWEPERRLAYRSDASPDGRFMAFEYLLEGRDGGGTVLRFVHSGFLGDDWEEEYDALRKGDRVYLEKLAVYAAHFAGRTAGHLLFIPGPQVPDAERVRAAFADALGITGPLEKGAPVRLSVEGLDPAEGVVEFVSRPDVVFRTDDGIHTLLHGYRDTVVVEYHGFAPGDQDKMEQAWRAWLDRLAA